MQKSEIKINQFRARGILLNGALVMNDLSPREIGSHPETGKYDTAQMMLDELYGGNTDEPLFD